MAASVRASQAGLNKIDQARRSKGWAKTEQAWYQLALTSEATLKRFWARNPVKQETFAAICQAVGIEDWRTIADLSIPSEQTLSTLPPLPGIYGASTWVERIELTETLLPLLQSERRIIVLTGMTGIGKTALAERLTLPLQDDRVLRRLNLDDGGVTPDFATSGAALLRSLGEEPTLEDQKDAKNLLNHILDRLRTRPTRIQIDSMEKLLEGDERQGWSEFCDSLWLDLLQQVLAGSECQSQIILTSQDVPGKLEAIGSRYPQRWHCEPIRGLSEAEQLQLFQNHGIVAACNASAETHNPNATAHNANVTTHNANATTHNANAAADNANATGQHRNATAHNDTEPNSAVSLLKRIGKLYEGHPLVLRVIAEDIKTCGGDVQRYWQQCRFEELEADRPVKFSRRKLQLEVNQRVRDSLERLPDDAKQLLCRSAVYRRPVPESFWLALLPDRTEAQQQAALNLLKALTFAEEDWEPGAWLGAEVEIPLRQHNLICSVAYDLLKAETIWETAERQAADQWLTAYQPAADVPNLEKVRGQIEAFHHFCELVDWEKASEIYTSQVGTNQQTFDMQLLIWGYYKELMQVSSRLVGKIKTQTNRICLNQLGNTYSNLGNVQKSIEYYQQALNFAREIGDRQGEGAALGNLGSAYYSLGNYGQAIEFHQQNLTLAREIGDRQGEGIALGNLGSAYDSQGNYEQAIEFHQQNLTLAREIGDRRGEGAALGNLGSAYDSLGNYGQAIEFHQQYLAIAREIGDRRGEGIALGNLGSAYYNLGNYGQAIEFHQQNLTLAREIGDRRGEGRALGNLGIAYYSLGNYGQAIESHQQNLTLAREIGDRQGEGNALGNLGIAYYSQGNYGQAIEFYQQHLAIAREIGDRQGEGIALGNLGITHEKLGDYAQASEYAQQHLRVARDINDRRGEGAGLRELGVVLMRLKQYSESLEHLQNALTIFQDIRSRNDEASALKNLAELHQKIGEIDQARQYCDRALGLAIELGIPLVEECRSLQAELNKEVNYGESRKD